MVRIVIKDLIQNPFVLPVVDGREHTIGPLIEFIGRHVARKGLQRPVQKRTAHVSLRLFFPRLCPILDGGKGHKHAVITPQVPARGAVGQAIFDHQAHRHVDDPMGVVTAGRRHIAEIDVEVLPARRAVVRRVSHPKINRTSGGQIAQVVQSPLSAFVAIGQMVTSWAGGVLMVTAVRHTLRSWEILDVDNALGRVWHVFTRSEHSVLP